MRILQKASTYQGTETLLAKVVTFKKKRNVNSFRKVKFCVNEIPLDKMLMLLVYTLFQLTLQGCIRKDNESGLSEILHAYQTRVR